MKEGGIVHSPSLHTLILSTTFLVNLPFAAGHRAALFSRICVVGEVLHDLPRAVILPPNVAVYKLRKSRLGCESQLWSARGTVPPDCVLPGWCLGSADSSCSTVWPDLRCCE